MSDLDVIKEIAQEINEPLSHCELDSVMNGNARCRYALDEQQQVVGLNLQNANQNNLLLVSQLKHLLLLNLSLNQISQLSPLKSLTKLTHLNLQKNNLTDISALRELDNLIQLNLQDNQISELKPLKYLKNLSLLNLQANQISELKFLADLDNLTVLNLSANQIKNLEPIKFLKQLMVLSLSSNQISNLDSLQLLTNLIELDLRFNQIDNLCALKSLKKLLTLYLSSNAITDIESLAELRSLTQLYLSNNKITDISALQELYQLVELDLRFNQISQIKALENLRHLSWLFLENNQISNIAPLENLKKLTQLNLRSNQVRHIEPLKNLKKLNQLYLSNNKIQLLPKWVTDFNLKIKLNSGGDGITVMGNPLKYPPPEVVRQGNLAIKSYFENLEQQQQRPLNEVKICFVGDNQVGKTALKNLLCSESVSPNQTSTPGIHISDWQYQNITAHCWDFGGDNNLQILHNLFFSEQSLYILVLDNRAERNEERWLKKIEFLAGSLPILIVLNKSDEPSSRDVDRNHLINCYNSLQSNSFFTISCTQNTGIEELKQGIINSLNHFPLLKKQWHESWIQVKKTIVEQLKQQHYFSAQLYTQICQQQGIKEAGQQELLLQMLHNLGIVVHFGLLSYADTYLLEPKWISKSLYKIIASPQLKHANGILFIKDLADILKPDSEEDYRYSVENYRCLINVMLNLELCFLLDKSRLLIPFLLDSAQPECDFNFAETLRFRIHYEYLNQQIMSRLIVALHEDINEQKCWRSGVFLYNKSLNSYALAQVNDANKLITIHVSGEKKRQYYAIIRKALCKIEASL